MTFKIDHFSHREYSSKTHEHLNFISVNLVFTYTKDEELFSWFKRNTLEYVPAKVILDTELYDRDLEASIDWWCAGNDFNISDQMTKSNEVEGFVHGTEYLTYLPKFEKFQFNRSFYSCHIVRGFIQDIEDLRRGTNETGTTDDCLLFYLLEAASRIL
jgi:hypothetical protein